MKPRRNVSFFGLSSLAALAFALSPTAHAATFTWDGGGIDNQTVTGANWVGDVAPGTGQDLVFSGTSSIGTSINWNLTNGNNPRSLTFDASSLAYDITGTNFIQFTQGITVLANNSSNAQSISNPIHVFGNSTKTFSAGTAALNLGLVTFRADGLVSGNNNQLTLSGSSNGTISGGITETGGFAAGATRTLNKTGTGTWTVNGAMTGAYAVNANAGSLVIGGSGTNTYSGAITVNGGNLVIQKASGLGATSAGTSIAGATSQGSLQFDSSSGAFTSAEGIAITMRSSVTNGGASAMVPHINNIGGSTTLSGAINSTTGGAVAKIAADAGMLTLSGSLNAQGASPTASTRITTLQGAGTGIISGLITQSTAITHRLDKFGSGTWQLTNAGNTFTGEIRLVEGTISIPSIGNGGLASTVGASSNAASNLQFNGGTLRYTGSGHTTDRLFTIGANGATLNASGTGAIVFGNTGSAVSADGGGTGIQYSFASGSNTIATNDSTTLRVGMSIGGVAGIPAGATITAINHSTGILTLSAPTTAAANITSTGTASGNFDRTLTLTGTNLASNEIKASLANATGGGKLGVTKNGAGTWVLSGTNTYTGPTQVDAGKLVLTGSIAAGSAFSLNNGATLSGEGAINGSATFGGTTGSTFLADGSTPGTLSVGGNLTLSGPVDVAVEGITSAGTYNIVSYSSITGGANFTSTFHRNPVFNVGASVTSLTLSSGLALTWTGNNGSSWDSASTVNWSGAEKFYALDSVTFDDTSSVTSISINGDLRPLSIQVSSNTNQFTFGGTGVINGAGTLTKSGSSTLVLNGSNGYTGTNTLNGGLVEFSANSLGTGAINFNGGGLRWATGNSADVSARFGPLGSSGAVFDINGNSVTLGSALTGSGGFTRDGSGSLVLSGANTYSGVTTLNAGTTFTNTTSALGSTAAGTTVASGAQLNVGNLANNSTLAEPLTVSGNGDGSGVLRVGGSRAITLSGAITMAAASTFKADGGSSFIFSGGITGSGNDATFSLDGSAVSRVDSSLNLGSGNLVKSGTATLVLNGSSSYAATQISAGTLMIGNQSAAGAPGSGSIVNNGTLHLNRSDSSLVVNNTISGTGNLVVGITSGGSASAIVTVGGNNSFAGNIDVRSGGLRITHSNALGTGTKNIALSNGTAGKPQLRLDGSGGSILLPSTISLTTSNNDVTNPAVRNEAGNNTIAGNFILTSGGGDTRIIVSGGTLSLTGNIEPNVSGRTLILDGPANGTASGILSNDFDTPANTMAVRKEGAGVWTLSGANTYSGVTTVTAGTLLANNSTGSATGSGAVSVTGGTLGGTGSIAGNVTIGSTGTLSPGASIETLGTGALAFTTGSTFLYELDTTLAAGDRLDANGNLTLDGTVTLTLADLGGGAALPMGTKFNLISYFGTWDGDVFNGLANGSSFSLFNNEWLIRYDDSSSGAVNSTDAFANAVTLTVIPEPAAGLLGGIGLLVLLRRRR